nr:reverse transcriptase domain-containing protein [Tanacetum cinerariifolium]
MSTRSSTKNLFPPLDNPELTIQRRSRSDPTLLNNSEMATEGNGDLPVPDLRTLEELCQPSLNGRGGPIALIAIQVTNFRLKNDMIQQVQNSCQFHGLPGDDANKHLDEFLHVTQSIKVNGVTDDALYLYLFPHSLTHHATAWFDHLPRNSINTFEQMAKMFLGKYFPPSMVTKLINEIINFCQCLDESLFEAWEQGTFMKRRPEECYDLIENMIAHHNDWNTSAQRITPNYETYGGPHSFNDCPAIVGNTQNVYAAGAYLAYQAPTYQASIYQAPVHQPQIPQPQVVTTNEFTNFMKANDAILKNMQTNMTSLTYSNLELKNMFVLFMKMNAASSSGSGALPVVERETEATKDMVHPTNNESIKDVQPSIVPTGSLILNFEPVVVPIIEPVASSVSAPRPNQRLSILYPSRLHDQKLRDKANDQREKFFQIFKDLNFNISFADALILMPMFGPSIKSILTNKNKLSELARTSLNEHCLVVLLKKLPEKLADSDKFLIPCDFPRMVECLALADPDASINLMPLSVWNKLLLPDLSPTCMTLELTDRSISCSVRVTEDVFVKVGTFHFSAYFVIVDFDADLRVPLILEKSFLKTERALIDVFEGELTLHVGKEAIIFNLDQTSRYSANYNDMTANQIDVIDMACEDDFLLEEVDAFLALEDDPTSSEVDQSYELEICEAKTDKSSIDEPPEVELKDLPPHLEYVFLEGDDKLPVIIAKDLSVGEKTALITEKTTFTCPYRTFAYRRMPFGLCNAPSTSQRCMMAIFHDMIEKTMEVFMDDFLVFENSFQTCLSHLEKMLKRCEDTNLCLNWEKSHFVVKEGIVFSYKISKNRIEVEKPNWMSLPNYLIQQLSRVMLKYGVAHRLAIPYHPQTNGLVEVSNHGLKRILERTAGENRASWSDKLDDALWAFRTTYKTPIGCTLYKLVYGKACHLPIELEHKADWALKHANFDLQTTGDHKKVQLNELCDQAYENSLIYKEKTKRLHDSKIKDRVFNIGDTVLFFNSRLRIFSGKLKSRWSGPFTISHVFPYGTVKLSQPDEPNFKVNGHRLKHYFEEDVPEMVVPDLQTFPKDH